MRTIKHIKPEDKLPILPLSRIIFFIFIILLIYFLFYFNYFQIRKIIIVNSKNISDAEIENEAKSLISHQRFYIFSGQNIFLVNKSYLKYSLKQKFSQIDRLEISRIFPDVLKIKLYEKEPRTIWQSKDKYYFIDAGGVAFTETTLSSLEENPLPKIQDFSGKDVQIFENVLFAKHINFIQRLNERLPQEGIKIVNFALPAKLADEIHVQTDVGWKIYFNVEKDVEAQISNLKLVLSDEIKERRPSLEYVDLRVENWVYYKMRSAPQPVKQSVEVKMEKKAN